MAEIKVFKDVTEIGLDADSKEELIYHTNLIEAWLDRGDGCAVYENQDLGHPGIGHRVFMSFGSEKAIIEGYTLPRRCPDTKRPMWQYYLVGYIPPKAHEVTVE